MPVFMQLAVYSPHNIYDIINAYSPHKRNSKGKKIPMFLLKGKSRNESSNALGETAEILEAAIL